MYGLNLIAADGSRGSMLQGQDIVWTAEPEAETVSATLTFSTAITLTGDQWREYEMFGRSLDEIDHMLSRALAQLVATQRDYAIQGRKCGDDEDILVVISAANEEAACEAFHADLDGDDDVEVFITHIATGLCLEVLS